MTKEFVRDSQIAEQLLLQAVNSIAIASFWSNPWVVVPGQPTERLSQLVTAYQPMGAADWENPPNAKDIKGCDKCHSIPKLTAGYCSVAGRMIKAKIMPPAGNGGVDTFLKECASP